jgi:hypothetical protein
MKNINISKVASLLEIKKQSGNQQLNKESKLNSTSNLSSLTKSKTTEKNEKTIHNSNNSNNIIDKTNQSIPSSGNFFRVTNLPNEKFGLFEKKHFYHFDKKFHLYLPNVVVPPISFHYLHSTENFASFDGKTMMLGLKKHHEIMTDTRLNTKIHKDFMENTINLLFPDRHKSNLLEESSMKILKKEVLDIIESKDKEEIKRGDDKKDRDNSGSFYLRKSTIMGSALNVKKKDFGHLRHSYNNSNDLTKETLNTLKNKIEETFEKSQEIKEGMPHPDKKEVVARNVYSILPFFEYSDVSFSQWIFPNDPLNDIKNVNLPDKFILKKKEADKSEDLESNLYSFYKVENNISSSDELNIAKYFSYERDFLANYTTNENELFNRNFLFLNRENKVARILPIENKVFLKKYKKVVYSDNYDNEDSGANTLSRKRKREANIILIPRSMTKEEREIRNRNLKEKGVQMEIKKQAFDNVNMEECNEAMASLQRFDEDIDDQEEPDLFDSSEGDDNSDEDEEQSGLSNHTEKGCEDD